MRLWLELHWWITATSSHAAAEEPSHLVSSNGVLSRSRYINSGAAQRCDQIIDQSDYSSSIIMPEDVIRAIRRYKRQSFAATMIQVTHGIVVQFPHI